jgi:hypothetical protein
LRGWDIASNRNVVPVSGSDRKCPDSHDFIGNITGELTQGDLRLNRGKNLFALNNADAIEIS